MDDHSKEWAIKIMARGVMMPFFYSIKDGCSYIHWCDELLNTYQTIKDAVDIMIYEGKDVRDLFAGPMEKDLIEAMKINIKEKNLPLTWRDK